MLLKLGNWLIIDYKCKFKLDNHPIVSALTLQIMALDKDPNCVLQLPSGLTLSTGSGLHALGGHAPRMSQMT